MKKKFCILIALVMAISLCLSPAVASAAGGSVDYSLSKTGEGTAEISNEFSYSESHSVKLLLPSIIVGEDMAQVVFDYGKPLNTLDSVSFWGMLEDSLPSGLYYSRPRIFLEIDTNGNGAYEDGIDARVEQAMYPLWTELGKWYGDEVDNDGDDQTFGSGDGVSHIKIFDDRAGLAETSYVQRLTDVNHAYLGQLKLETYSGDKTWGELTVVRIKVGIGGWIGPYNGTVIAFIDDITINGDLYDFEPPPAPVRSPDAFDVFVRWGYDSTRYGFDGALGSSIEAAGKYNDTQYMLEIPKGCVVTGTPARINWLLLDSITDDVLTFVLEGDASFSEPCTLYIIDGGRLYQDYWTGDWLGGGEWIEVGTFTEIVDGEAVLD